MMNNAGQAKPAGSRGERMTQELGINKQHSSDVENIIKYMEKHRIQELFNEILTRILDERPQDAKAHIVEYLKTAQRVQNDDPLSQKLYAFQDQDGNEDTYLT